MKVVCIGAGRLAHHLMLALQTAGCDIVQVYNRTQWPAVLLAKRMHAANHTTDISEIDQNADLYFLTLSDDVISDIANQLEDLHGIQGVGVHCSGVLGQDILPFENRGVFYPLQTFSEHHEVEWHSIPIIITSENKEVANKLKTLALKISSAVYEMTDQQKTVVHLSAVFANNFTNHMLTLAETICKENNVPFEILKPLIETTFHKALTSGPSISQTGPAMRGDETTLEKHLHLLEKHPEMIEVYKVITNSISK
jgi:predicted short-subunit dehydrogenase-like oxidoreductase (DUF2520 family)